MIAGQLEDFRRGEPITADKLNQPRHVLRQIMRPVGPATQIMPDPIPETEEAETKKVLCRFGYFRPSTRGNDHIVAAPYNPETQRFDGEINVARPWTHRRSVWHHRNILNVNTKVWMPSIEREVLHFYTEDGTQDGPPTYDWRVTRVLGEDEEPTLDYTEWLYPPYKTGFLYGTMFWAEKVGPMAFIRTPHPETPLQDGSYMIDFDPDITYAELGGEGRTWVRMGEGRPEGEPPP
jgi:hypothetical protein